MPNHPDPLEAAAGLAHATARILRNAAAPDLADVDYVDDGPSVVLRLGPSFITRDARGEILETVETLPNGLPDWREAGICDARGSGSRSGHLALCAAVDCAEYVHLATGARLRRLTA
jgi:hypothetical protein